MPNRREAATKRRGAGGNTVSWLPIEEARGESDSRRKEQGSIMPTVAILSDIHGNLPALDGVLAQIAAERIEHIVCLGDVATLGPQPHEVIVRLRGLGCPVVMGNTDADLLALAREESAKGDVWGSQDFDF